MDLLDDHSMLSILKHVPSMNALMLVSKRFHLLIKNNACVRYKLYREPVACASHGDLGCLQYMHENMIHLQSFNKMIGYCAASNGHLNCLRYAAEHAFGMDAYTCVCAARSGHLDCLTYAHVNGPDSYEEPILNEHTCSFAARHGQLECLKYLHEHGCPWDVNTILYAKTHGHHDCMMYAMRHGCPTDGISWCMLNDLGISQMCALDL
jgi:hypothetical protein